MSRILYVIDRPNSYGSEQHLFDVVSFQHRSHAVRVLRGPPGHLGAPFLRNHAEWSSRIVYFGPMGCRTGFYLVVFGEVTSEEILPLVRELFEFVAGFEGDVPGAAPEECGNYLDQNLPMANWLARRYLDRDLIDIDEAHLHYQQA